VQKGGHAIDSDVVRVRYRNRVESLRRVLPYCNEVKFYDNENGFAEVGEYRNGTFRLCENAPDWLRFE
jgi:predicted ABC-type ATPase